MADDNDLDINDDAGGSDELSSASSKKKGLGGLFPVLLKWVAIGLVAVILIVTVVVITMKVVGGNQSQAALVPVTEEYSSTKEILDWYNSLRFHQNLSPAGVGQFHLVTELRSCLFHLYNPLLLLNNIQLHKAHIFYF